jgi:hypothetical protein
MLTGMGTGTSRTVLPNHPDMSGEGVGLLEKEVLMHPG